MVKKEMCETIDAYILSQPEIIRPILTKIRETIHSVAPYAVEKISYRMPVFRQKENLIYFAAFKNHIGIYPGAEAVAFFAEKLTAYKTSKGAIQFSLDKPVDYNLIAEITRWRMKQIKDKEKRTKVKY